MYTVTATFQFFGNPECSTYSVEQFATWAEVVHFRVRCLSTSQEHVISEGDGFFSALPSMVVLSMSKSGDERMLFERYERSTQPVLDEQFRNTKRKFEDSEWAWMDTCSICNNDHGIVDVLLGYCQHAWVFGGF
jgi:hypothetical protein